MGLTKLDGVGYGGQPTTRAAMRVISVSERVASLRSIVLIKVNLLLIAIFKPSIGDKSYCAVIT